MELKEYQQQTLRTLKLINPDMDIAHMLFGMNGEFNELYNAIDDINRGEELTDQLWYLSNYCNMKEITLYKIFDFKFRLFYYELKFYNYIEKLQCEISILTDLEKKKLIYGKEISIDEIKDQVIEIAKSLNDCYSYYEIDPQQAMENNIAKLKVRYPEKFTEENALNRNLELERKVLENK